MRLSSLFANVPISLDMFKMTVQPNAKLPAPHYPERWDEAVYGLSRTLTWTVDGTPFRISPGQSRFIKRGEWCMALQTKARSPTPAVVGMAYFREVAACCRQAGLPMCRCRRTWPSSWRPRGVISPARSLSPSLWGEGR
jgi:hypothetical protein